MTELTVTIITYNEERNIGECLDSIKDLADDIVVIDSFSTDRTKEIAEAHGARVVQNTFNGYIEQKNFAISQAKYPYILSLDADERLSEELKRSILSVKENWEYDGYYFNRLTNYCGKWIRFTSWYPARKLRLWDSRKGCWGGINPHDRFIMEKGATKRFLKGDLLHYSYYSITEHVNQLNTYSSIVARAYRKQGIKSSYLKILLHPSWRFFRDFFIRLGFLDGYYGFVVCMNTAHETFLKYIKLKDIQKQEKFKQREKICFFNSVKPWGGGEKWHFDMASYLSSRGRDILVITDEKSELRYRLLNKEIPVISFRVTNLSFLNPFKILLLARILRNEGIDTIIINLSSDLKIAGIASKLAGVRDVIYRRGSAIPVKDSILNRFLFKKVINGVIANSEETKRTILLKNPDLIDPGKIKIIYNGIHLEDIDTSEFEKIYSRKEDEIIIGNAGRIEKQKGQRHLIELASVLKARRVKFKILIAGEGKLKHELITLVKAQGLEDEIIFIGFVSNIKSFMESIDIFVLSSLWEGFGYVLVEAMACEKPVVAFDVSSNPEIITDNQTGYLIKAFDMNSFAEKLELLVNDSKLRIKMGKEGRKRVEDEFSISRTRKNLENYLDKRRKMD